MPPAPPELIRERLKSKHGQRDRKPLGGGRFLGTTTASTMLRLPTLALLLAVAASGAQPQPAHYTDLVTLFKDWRTFQRPKLTAGVHDYRAAAMAAQKTELAKYQRRLEAIDTTGWPIASQVDYHIVRAEMNGLDFDHRVLKPWVNNPAFYVTVFNDESDQPAREGPHAAGMVELVWYKRSLSAKDAAAIDSGIRMIPALLEQARVNLTGSEKDLWNYGIGEIKAQSAALTSFSNELTAEQGALKTDVAKAKAATDGFVQCTISSRSWSSSSRARGPSWRSRRDETQLYRCSKSFRRRTSIHGASTPRSPSTSGTSRITICSR